MVQVHCTSITVNGSGRYLINFEDGAQLEFDSLVSLQNTAGSLDAPDQLSTAQTLLLAYWLARDASAESPSIIAGKKLTFDMGSVTPVLVESA